MTRTMVVAEPGCTHEGDVEKLVALVDVAADAGCDAFKGQFTSDPELLAARRSAPEYLPFYQWLRYPVSWHARLAERCAQRGIAYAVTVYLPGDVAQVDPWTTFYKVSSFEAGATDLLKAIYTFALNNQKRIVVSLGLGAQAPAPPPDLAERLTLLRCVSAYPTPLEDLQLGRIKGNGLDGLSDHTPAAQEDALNVGALAVAAGATWIERHIRLENCRPENPDYPVSLGSHQLTEYVRRIRVAEQARGDGKSVSRAEKSEEPMLRHRADPAKKPASKKGESAE